MLDSDQRVSAAEALAHAYFSQYHDPDDEPEAEPYDESVEAKERTLEEWKGEHRAGGRGEGEVPRKSVSCIFSEQDFTCFMQETPQKLSPSGLGGGNNMPVLQSETCKGVCMCMVCMSEAWRAVWGGLWFSA